MSVLRSTLLLALVAVVATVASTGTPFDEFLARYDKHYEGAEYAKRLRIFAANVEIAAKLTKGSPTGAVFDVNRFFDLTQEEFQSTVLMPPVPGSWLAEACLRQGVFAPHLSAKEFKHPDELDYSEDPSIVTSVKDQRSCGSCWAFSTIGNMEGVYGKNGKSMVGNDLSAQFLVDCSKGCSSEIYSGKNTTVCNGGCLGGWPWTAMNDVVKHIGGVPLLSHYQYTGLNGDCKKARGPVFTLSSYMCIGLDKPDNEDEIAEYLFTNGPLSVGLDANDLSYYSHGIVVPKYCGKQALNHAVLLVGYGTDENGVDFWKVKNSWGEEWGENGYFRLIRGEGACGINEAVTCAIA
eukprot:TRINITY_DN8535_c0_g1_i1.p1 TRINITY_DN8535_c0_g1~~TRINITY_DN8535_c0_g1_i1.p1  ORF type:complete len:350 (-),score=92.43 TRINITY_DN8535_c0_g1_i1:50-1099(-)